MDEELKKTALICWINGFDLGQNLQNLSQLRDGKHFNAILKYLNASVPQTKLKATCWQRTLRTYLEGYYQVNFDGKIDFNAAFKGDESELIKISSYLLCTSLAGPKNSKVMKFLINFDLSTQEVIRSIIEIAMQESDILNFNINQAAKSCNAVTPTSSPTKASFNSRSSPICQLLQSPKENHKVAMREKNELIKKLKTELLSEKEIRIDFENEANTCRKDAEETNKSLEKLNKDYVSAKLKIGELELKIQQHQYLIDEKIKCLKSWETKYKKQEEKLMEHKSLQELLRETEEENLTMKTKLKKLEDAEKKSSHGNNLLRQLELANEDLKRKLTIKMEEVVQCKKLLEECEFEAKRMKEMFLDKEEAYCQSPEIPEVGERLSTIIELELKASEEEIQQLRTNLEVKNEEFRQLIAEHELKTAVMNQEKLKLENQIDEILKGIEEMKIALTEKQSTVEILRRENQDILAKADEYLQQQEEIRAAYDIRLTSVNSELLESKKCFEMKSDELLLAENVVKVSEGKIEELETNLKIHQRDKATIEADLNRYKLKYENSNKENVKLVEALSEFKKANSNLSTEIDKRKSEYRLLEETSSQKLLLSEKELAERDEKIEKLEFTLNEYLEEKVKIENELSKFKSKFQSLNDETAELVNTRSHLENVNSNLHDQINDHKSRYASLENTMQTSLKDAESDYTGKIIELNQKIEEFQEQLFVKTEIGDNLQLRLNEISSELMNCQSCFETSSQKLLLSEKELVTREERIEKLELTLNEYLEEKIKIENELSEFKSKFQSLNDEIAALVNSRSDLENVNTNLHDQINDHKSQYTLLEHTMKTSLKDAESDYSGKIIELNQKIEEIQKQLLDKTEISDNLQLRLNGISSELMNCQSCFETSSEKLQRTEKELAERDEKIERLELMLNDYLEEKVKIENELSEFQTKSKSLNEEIAVLINARSDLEKVNSDFQDKLNDQNSQYTLLEKTLESKLKNAENEYTVKIIDLNQKLEEFQKQVLDKTEKSDNLQFCLNNISSELIDLKNCFEDKNEELRLSENEVKLLSGQLEEAHLISVKRLEEIMQIKDMCSDLENKNSILLNSLANAETEWNLKKSECDSNIEVQIQLNVEIEKLKNANEILSNRNLNYVTMIDDIKQQLADVQTRFNKAEALLQQENQIRISVETTLENSLQEKKRFESEIFCLSEKLTNLSNNYNICHEQNSSLTEKIASVESECCFLKMKEVEDQQKIEDNELQKQKSIYEENLASLTNEMELNKSLYKEELEKLLYQNQTLSSAVQKLEEDNVENGKESLEWKNKYQFLIKQNVKEINKLREDYEKKLLEAKNNKELQLQVLQLQQQVITSEEKHCKAIDMLTTMNENLKDESTRHSLYYENIRLELTTKDKIIEQLKKQMSENQLIANQDRRETITLSRSMGKTYSQDSLPVYAIESTNSGIANQDRRETITLSRSMGKTHSQASLPAYAIESTNSGQTLSMTETNIGRQSFSMTNLLPSSKLNDYVQSSENLFDRTLSTIPQNSFACRLPGSARQWVACEDEEGEFHNVSYLQDLKRGDMRSGDGRLDELQRRNTLCLPHLRTSYPLETVLSNVNFKEEDFKSGKINIPKVEQPWQGVDKTRIISAISNENLQPLDEPSERRKTKVIQPNYHKPGPPTPGKSSKTQDLNHGKRTPNSVRNLFKRPSLTPKSYAKYKVASPKRDNNENNPPSTYIQVMHKIPIKKNTAFDIGFSPKVKKTKAVFKKNLQVTSTPLAKKSLN